MKIGTVDTNQLKGISDKFLGLSKEYVGVLVNSTRLQEEGEAQQAKAARKLKALRLEVKQEVKAVKATAAAKGQRVARAIKQS
jgi:uncharacterized protein YjbJ (UPF0337 family)